ncbi:hypothetical protein [Pseudomonas sp. UMAB-40]|uniref:hypothetical protein n=1 Tax=Pseudomonas sp. UMAB-40 TaxID=1365407 RepID=UPI001C57F2EE|nr:hypothetical protein [Pseudomonas sp. UMAB-40]
MSREEQNKHLTDSAEWLKNHAYTELVNSNGVEVWRCQQPGSIHLAFDICITRFGIAVFGDIGSLTFGVGASYGMKFLAGKDGDYIYGKLEASSKTTEFDRPGFIARVEEAICHWLAHSRESAPAWFDDYCATQGRSAEIEAWLLEHCDGDQELSAVVVALREARAFEGGSSQAHEWLTDHEELLEVSDTWEWDLRKPTDSVLRRLARVRHAARMIVAQKAAAEAAAQATEYCYALGPADERWSSDSLASYVSDHELPMGAVIQRAVVSRSRASSFLPDANDVIEHMANAADDENSEFADGFPNETKEQEAELERLLKPLQAWADRTFDVSFYTVENDSIESYVVTAEDVAAGEAYREAL